MFQNIRTAVVGAGFIGPVHVEALKRVGVTVTGILGVDDKESVAAQQKLGLPRAYKNIDEIVSDATVQAVHLAVPNVLHYPLSKKVILAGKHVMCEKPLAMNSRESAELVGIAKSKRVAAAVCYNQRFYPMNLEARDMVRRGDVGQVFHINGCYCQDWLFYETDYNWRVLSDQGGELRAVSDIGTHWMDMVTSITGLEIEAVLADLKNIYPVRKRPKGEVAAFAGKMGGPTQTEPIATTSDDYGAVLLHFKGGARGSFHVSQVNAGRKNCFRWEIAGSKCALAWCQEAPNELWIGRRDKANEVLIRDPSLLSDLARRFCSYPGGHNEGFPDAFKNCFRAFYEYIAAGDFSATPFFPTFADGHREIILCDAILKSHREQRWVNV